MKNFAKFSIGLIFVFALVAGVFVALPAETKKKSYYSGTAINYQGQVYIATTNTGSFELFSLQGGKIYKKLTISSFDKGAEEFYDVELFEDGGRLYAHLVNGRYLYKYNISDPTRPERITKVQDNSWDWFLRLKRIDGKLATIGSKQIKIWNDAYQVINSYDIRDESLENRDNPENITFSQSGNYFISADKDKVAIYDANKRVNIADFKISANGNKREIVNDELRSLLYLVDDESLKAVGFDGKVVKEFKHTSSVGYNVVESYNTNYLYFSDGIGVVKSRKSDLKPVDWKGTLTIANSGSWAMGITPVWSAGQEYLVVFNGSNILVLDGNMEKVDHYEAVVEDSRPTEPLFLGLDKTRAAANTQVSVRGRGFGLNEEVEISLGRDLIAKTKTDSWGRFLQVVEIPAYTKAERTDLKAVGKNSGLSYSIAFELE